MNEPAVVNAISVTQRFRWQLENFCRLSRISPGESRNLGKAIVERVCQAHSGNVIFSPGGSKVPLSMKLENGGVLKMLIVFEEIAPGGRHIQRILSARVVQQEPQAPQAQA